MTQTTAMEVFLTDVTEKQRHLILSLDPGITTGWAVLDAADGTIIGTSVWGTHELKETLDLLVRRIFTGGHTVECVVEKMPPGSYGKLATKLEAVRRDVDFVIRETYELKVTMIPPSEWKPSRVARTRKVPGRFDKTPLTPHQKDAIRMGWYFLSKEK